MKFHSLKTLLFSTALFTTSACGTVVKLVDPTESYSAYAGTKYDVEMATRWGLPILDVPLSFLLDTALLPYAWSKSE